MQLSKDQVIFGLDIGTRSVVGIVGYKTAGSFNVIANHIIEHDTRSMIDGQIHDVARVAMTIEQVKKALEEQLGFELNEVSIAAAGRVLKTCNIHVEQTVETSSTIDQDKIYALELLGIEKAHQEIAKEHTDHDSGFHCVGYTVSKYYLNKYEISKLEGHKGKVIGADVLATFLPKEVVESLYQVVDKAGLTVKNLTLEPIAAIDVAIPPNYRLLNIALVDVGAGTSDIAIAKEGSIVAYGMIPVAGDEITESIVHKYLVDFKTAEKIKIKSSGKSKKMTFKDIMGVKHQVDMDDVRQALDSAMNALARKIGQRIMELNNGQPTSAVFIVGGGGQLTGFDQVLADEMGLPRNRVALRGKEVLDNITFETTMKKGPELVTPIGICYSSLDSNKFDFIQVFFNDEPVKVFNANRITVMDIAAFKGYDPKRLLVSRGHDLTFDFNSRERVIKGLPGTPPKILINNTEASMNDEVVMNDYITIVDAKRGKPGAISTNQLIRELKPVEVNINNEIYTVKPSLRLNGEMTTLNHDVKNGDIVDVVPPTIKEAFMAAGITYNNTPIYVNGPEKTLTDYVYQGDIIMFDAFHKGSNKEQTIIKEVKVGEKEENHQDKDNLSKEKSQDSNSNAIRVVVNGDIIELSGKETYVFVDIFDYIDFDRTRLHGTLVCRVNQEKAGYMDSINDKDIIEVYWKQ